MSGKSFVTCFATSIPLRSGIWKSSKITSARILLYPFKGFTPGASFVAHAPAILQFQKAPQIVAHRRVVIGH